tara:strand:- start:156 stop:530 length:375 start_codon:yes stop_codon:yes gene_type:complete
MELTKKTCAKCDFVGIKEQDFVRSKIRNKYQYGNCKKCAHKATRAWRYNLSIEQMNRLLNEATHCGVCEKEFTTNRKVIDHCHVHKHIRGVLCDPCNTTLGQLEKEDHIIGNVIAYLLKNNKIN